ncbi:MMPL family transporter [Azospirillaceae bacterium]
MLFQFVRAVIVCRRWIFAATFLVTVLALSYCSRLHIVIDPVEILPQSHPFVASKSVLETVFNEKYALIVAVAPKSNMPYDAAVLGKVQRITDGLRSAQGIVRSTLLSVSSQNAKAISGAEDGFKVTPFRTVLDQPERLRELFNDNPLYQQTIVSTDRRMFAVIAEFDPDPMGYAAILSRVSSIIDRERDETVSIAVSGHVSLLGEIELYSARMIILAPIAIILIGLVLFDAFRSFQGLFLPLATANLALIWVLGAMGAAGFSLDVFNVSTPILILAVAAGHAVQILKRYYEEYDRLRESGRSPEEANHEAVVASVGKVGRFMIAAGLIAAAGFLSLTIFEIKTVKTFGIFTGVGILSALLIELTFMPALRSWLKPPAWPQRARQKHGMWDFIIARIVAWTPTRKPFVFWLLATGVAIFGAMQVRIENSNKDNLASWTKARVEDAIINNSFSGTQALFVMLDTGRDDGVKRPDVLAGVEALQRGLEKIPGVGKTVSIADFLKRMNQAMNGNRADAYVVPDTLELAGQYLLLYSMSGDPDDLKSYIDFTYRRANIKVFVRRDESPFILEVVEKAKEIIKVSMPSDVEVRFGGGVAEAAALNEVMVRDKLLNILQITAVVFVAAGLLFRSLFAGALVMLPLLITVIFNFGLLGWLRIPLNVPTSLISAMAVGIGADYAIYIISRYKEELARNPDHALSRTLDGAGKACLYVAASVAVGYGALGLSFGFKAHQWLALLIASAMFVSAFAALSLIPALLQRFRPQFLFRQSKGE